MDFDDKLNEAEEAIEELFDEARLEGDDRDHDEATQVMWRRRSDALGDVLDKLRGMK